ncbi:MAG TPA: O-antigen ligase family protein [Terriglobales bacterium]
MPDHWLWAYQVGPLTVIKCVGLAALVAALLRLLAKGTLPPLYRLPEAWCSFVYLLVAFVSCSSRDLAGMGLGEIEKILAILSLFIVTVVMVDTEDRFRRIILFAIAGQAFCSLYVVRQWFQFEASYSEFRSFGGLTDDANYFAIAVVLWLPVALMLVPVCKSRFERVFCAACAVTMLVGFLISGSRGGLIGVAIAALQLIWRSKRRLRNLLLTAFMSLALATASLFSGSSAVSRVLHPSAGDVASTQARLNLWKAALGVIKSHPLFGVGSAAFTIALSHDAHYNVSHNTYLDVLGELGLAGFLPFMGILILVYRRLGNLAGIRTHAPPALQCIATGFRAGLAGYFVGAFFLSTWEQQVLWLLVFLSMCMAWLQRAPQATPEQASRPTRGQLPTSRRGRSLPGRWVPSHRQGMVRNDFAAGYQRSLIRRTAAPYRQSGRLGRRGF